MNASELISNPKDRTELVIYRGTIEAGVLRRIENGCSFVFSRKFLQNSKYSDLSFRMPKSARPLITYGINLPPFFAGLLPEGLRLKVLLKKIKTSDDDLFSLFAAAGRNVAGDVYAKTDIDSSLTRPAPKLSDVDFFELFRQSLHEFETAFGNETLAGVQEKISAAMISFPINIAKASKSYILKLNPKETPSLVQNELICLNLARRCGIEIPKFKIIKDKNNNPGLLVERFDRIWNAEKKTFHLLHQEDACQFLQRYPADKYQLSVNDIVNGMQEIATAPTASVLKFFAALLLFLPDR